MQAACCARRTLDLPAGASLPIPGVGRPPPPSESGTPVLRLQNTKQHPVAQRAAGVTPLCLHTWQIHAIRTREAWRTGERREVFSTRAYRTCKWCFGDRHDAQPRPGTWEIDTSDDSGAAWACGSRNAILFLPKLCNQLHCPRRMIWLADAVQTSCCDAARPSVREARFAICCRPTGVRR